MLIVKCDEGSLNFVCYNEVDSSGNGHWNWGLAFSLYEDGDPWQKCFDGYDNDCPSGQKCYCGVCSATFTSAGCDENECCNREYGGTGVGECVDEGTPYGNYICISEIFISYPEIR